MNTTTKIAKLTRMDDEFWCGDYRLYRCNVERPNMLGWILRFDGELIAHPRTVAEAQSIINAR